MIKLLQVVVFFSALISSSQEIDSIILKLDQEIQIRDNYVENKNTEIASLKAEAHKIQLSGDSEEIYNSYIDLYKTYSSFKYDSAYYYLEKAKEIALNKNDSALLANAKIKEGFILLSAGLFTESLDTLNSVNFEYLQNESKYHFHFTKARCYFDLADYNDDNRYRINYIRKGIFNLSQSLNYVEPQSSEYLKANGLKNLKQQNWTKAEEIYFELLNKPDLSPQMYSVATSSLSYLYDQNNQEKIAMKYLGFAAISDIKNAITENIALRNLAIELYENGEVGKANHYVRVALQDATFYNARHRKNQISSILPIIESAQLHKLEQKNESLQNTVTLLAVLSLVILIFSVIIFKQLKAKKSARKALADYNKKLQQMNLNLLEADTIKQDYITYFLKVTSQLINKMGSLQKNTILKIKTKKPEEVLRVIQKYNVKNERAELFHQFDEVFLQLFPSFIEQLNGMFPEEEHRVVKKGELLNTELRILALYRLGIQDNKQVADFLDVSISTVYTYKTRLKSKSLHKNDFENQIMQVRKFY